MRFTSGLIGEKKNEHHRRWDNRSRGTGMDYRIGECDFMTNKLEQRSQELSGKTERLEAEIKRLQELADYRLKLLTKMPSEWVGLTDEDIAELRRNGSHSVSDADFRFIETKLKEKNCA